MESPTTSPPGVGRLELSDPHVAIATSGSDKSRARRVVAIVGPTATGKSDLAVALALALRERGHDAAIVNADSMQLYEGMDIGTAKLTADEQRGVAHHLLDIWPVTTTASVAEYQQRAREVIDELLADDVTPIVVGGSGLYLRAALDRFEFPGTDLSLRSQLEEELERVGAPAMHARLAAADPAAAAMILPTNGRRIVRAVEVIELTGRPFSATLPAYDAVYDVVQIGLDLSTEKLDTRVYKRVGRMFDIGLVDEVRALEKQGLRDGRTACRALGYQQVLEHLDGGVTELEAREETARATRRFVRRQRSWFRRDPRITWLDAAHEPLAAALDLATN
jgi:tRNA dimethylallyltransferase